MIEIDLLPSHRENMLPVMKTAFRKEIPVADSFIIDCQTIKTHVNQIDLQAFCSYFDTLVPPISYWYLPIQKIHIYHMLKKNFPFKLPGIVHVDNSIERLAEIDVNKALSYHTQLNIEKRERSGYLLNCQVDIYQEDERKLICHSSYLKRIKHSGKRSKKIEPDLISHHYKDEWHFPKNLGRQYAAVSGDYNPIHIYPLLAKLFGFKTTIAHGWLTASRCLSCIENQLTENINTFYIDFKKPVYLNTKPVFLMNDKRFQVIGEDGKVLTEGTFS